MTVTVVQIEDRSTNFWVVSAGTTRLLVDLGWPGRAGALFAQLERRGVPVAEIGHGLATHYHIDHAGAAQDLKNRGMRLLVTEEQVAAIPLMRRWTKPADGYTEISTGDNLLLPCAESRGFLARLGFAGEIVPTPGHSDDSVSLVLDDGRAFTGDLPPEHIVGAEDAAVVARSWQALRERGATMVHPGHGRVYGMPPPFERPTASR